MAEIKVRCTAGEREADEGRNEKHAKGELLGK